MGTLSPSDLTLVLALALGLAMLVLAMVAARMSGQRGRLAAVEAERDAARLAEREGLERRIAQALMERDQALAERDLAVEARIAADRAAAVAAIELDSLRRSLTDADDVRDAMLAHAKAAVLTTAHELSSKLLADHKQETEAAQRDTEARVTRATQHLVAQVDAIGGVVAALNRQVEETRATTQTVWRALSTPGGAGQFAEIGLENTLKAFGLEKGRDYVVQQAVEGRRLRPDAMVFLPGDTLLVIDAKASIHLLALAETEGTEAAEVAWRDLARTMGQHLKTLAERDYQAEIVAAYTEAGRDGALRRIQTVMYLANDGAVAKLLRADPTFTQKAAQRQIIVAGPSALTCLIGFARVEIDLGRRVAGHDRIVASTRMLLDGLGVVLEHVERLGRNLRGASDSYARLAASVNERLLPRTRELGACGVAPARHQRLPGVITAYHTVPAAAPPDGDGRWTDAAAEGHDSGDADRGDEDGTAASSLVRPI